jgi:O-antigen ligase
VASKVFSLSTIVLINFYSRFSKTLFLKLFWLISVLLGIYCIYTSWARTAWVVFALSFIILLFYQSSFKKKISSSLLVIAISFVISVFYLSNQALQYRMTDSTIYRTNTELSASSLLKTRLPFIIVAIDNLMDEGLSGQLIGYGTQRGIDLFDKKTGMAITSHNGTFEILESSGLIGLFLFLMFIYSLLKRVYKNLKHISVELKKIGFVSIFMFMSFFTLSHGSSMYSDIIYSCFFVAIIIESLRLGISNKKNKING